MKKLVACGLGCRAGLSAWLGGGLAGLLGCWGGLLGVFPLKISIYINIFKLIHIYLNKERDLFWRLAGWASRLGAASPPRRPSPTAQHATQQAPRQPNGPVQTDSTAPNRAIYIKLGIY